MKTINNYITEKLHLKKDSNLITNEVSNINVGDICCLFTKIESQTSNLEIIVPDIVKVNKITNKKYTITYLTNFSRLKDRQLSFSLDNSNPPHDWVYRGFPTFQKATKTYVTLDAKQALKFLNKVKKEEKYYLEWLDLLYVNCPKDYNQRRKSMLCVHRHNINSLPVTFQSAGSMKEEELNELINKLS